jgi:hypothetical protein
MLPRELVSTVGPITPARPSDQLADPRQQALQRALAPQLGKALHGEVLSRLTDGSFVVKVADIPTRMLLPPGARVGADVPLTLVAVQPRPTFQIGTGTPVFSEAGPPLPEGADPARAPLLMREGATAAGIQRATALLQAAAAGAAGLAGGAEGQHTNLSRTGQAIGGVLAAAAKAETPQTAALGRTPVVAAAGADATSIAQGLQQAVGKSGLFYESHVAEWAQGARLLSDLNAEPQQQAAREGQRPLPTDPATAQFINLQLATQEQAQVSWQGNLWPGQPMQLDVQREARRDTANEEEGQADGDEIQERAWHSRLRLTFPGLGELDARLTLSGGVLQLRVSASEDSAALLRRNQPSLAGALDAAGTPLAAFEVRSTGGLDKAEP